MYKFAENFPHMDSIDYLIASAVLNKEYCHNRSDGKTLRELFNARIKQLGLSNRSALKMMSVDAKSLDPILDGTARQPSLLVMLKLGYFLGMDISEVVKSYSCQFTPEILADIQRARVMPYLIEQFDIKSLESTNFLQKDMSSQAIADRLCKFFGLCNIFEYSNDYGYALSSAQTSASDKMRAFWLRAAICQLQYISNPHKYSRPRLLALIPKIRIYSRDEANGLASVMKALFYHGVTVIYQPSIKNVGIRGATMVINGKPCIVISDYAKKYPTLWFSLLHELYHVLYDLDDIATRAFHISSDEGDLFLTQEERANHFARVFFTDESRMKFIQPYLSSPLLVEKYAREWGIHPSIIYANDAYDSKKWGLYAKLIPSMDRALRQITSNVFECETIIESAEQFNNLYANI